MHMQCDSLKYAKLLEKSGFNTKSAQGLVSMLTSIEIYNIYSKAEVDIMLSEAVREIFDHQDKKLSEQRREYDSHADERRREFDVRMQSLEKYHEQQLTDNRREMLASRRWVVGTVITVGFSLAAYLSAMLHLTH